MANELLTADDPSVSQLGSTVQWGLYKNGKPVIVAETVLVIGLKSSSDIPTYPQELGQFQSYNKVQLPFSGRIRFARGGSLADRTAFLNSVDAAKMSLDLYDFSMAEKTWPNVNVLDYDVDRKSSSGLGLLIIDVVVEEVRITASAAFSNTKAPSGAAPVNDGTVTTVPPTAEQKAKIENTMESGGGW